MSHQAQVPRIVADYFNSKLGPGAYAHPIVEQVFRPGLGWRVTGYRKTISRSWARKLRAEGVTEVALRTGDRLADFRIKEVLR